MSKYSRVSYAVRCQISALLQANTKISEIASILKFNKSTIYREIKRNSVELEYSPSVAEKKYKKRFINCRKPMLIRGDLMVLIEQKISLYWTPEQISGRLKLESNIIVSHETIYKYVRNKPYLSSKLPFLNKGGLGRYIQRKRRKENYLSIHKRPSCINNRERIGDWERDGMYLSNKKQLLVCTDRKTRFTKIAPMRAIDGNSVNQLTVDLLKETNMPIMSITNDNGTEFRKQLKGNFSVFYCDPMKPNQRGTVENTIGLLRKRLTRKTDINLIGEEGIKLIEKEFNLTPRKILDFKTPFEVFYGEPVALVS